MRRGIAGFGLLLAVAGCGSSAHPSAQVGGGPSSSPSASASPSAVTEITAACVRDARALTTFDYEHLPDDIARAKAVATPAFGVKYATTLQQAEPQAVTAKAVVTESKVTAGVIDVDGDVARCLTVFAQKAALGDGRPTKITPYITVLTVDRVGGAWLVDALQLDTSRFPAVTSAVLTAAEQADEAKAGTTITAQSAGLVDDDPAHPVVLVADQTKTGLTTSIDGRIVLVHLDKTADGYATGAIDALDLTAG